MELFSVCFIALLAVLIIFIVFVIGIYNTLVKLRNRVRNSWSQIDVQLKRRHNLIPNLVETVKGYAGHEKQTLENVTRARNQAMAASGAKAQGQAESMLTGALGRLLVTVEAYPELKANQNFLSLQEELASTENKIGFARQAYNDDVMQYNTKTESFPANIVAGMFRFVPEEFFELADEAAREVPEVKF